MKPTQTTDTPASAPEGGARASAAHAKEARYPTEGLKTSRKRGSKRVLTGAFALFWVMLAMMGLSVDLLLNRKATWSVPLMCACAYAALQTAAFVFLSQKYRLLSILAAYLLANAALAALDALCTGSMRFYLILGLPITSILAALSLALWLSKRFTGIKKLNMAGLFLLLSVPCAIGIDLLSSAYAGKTSVSWSLVALAVCLPSAGICFCLYHYFKTKEAFFHR